MGRILITGASGLIGTATASILERNGHQIIGMDIKPRSKHQVRADVRSIENMSYEQQD